MNIEFIVGVILGIGGILIGIITGYIFYRKSLRTKEPRWAIRSNNIVQGYSSRFSNVTVLYKDEAVENLTISKVWIWNDGKETITAADTQTINPFRVIGVGNARILDAIKLKHNSDSSQIDVVFDKDQGIGYFKFDYLDHKMGGLFQIVHTGLSSKEIQVVGDIRGAQLLEWSGDISLLSCGVVGVTMVCTAGLGVAGLMYFLPRIPATLAGPIQWLLGIGILGMLFALSMVTTRFIDFAHNRMRKGPRGMEFGDLGEG